MLQRYIFKGINKSASKCIPFEALSSTPNSWPLEALKEMPLIHNTLEAI
jgi:hypothetical protein